MTAPEINPASDLLHTAFFKFTPLANPQAVVQRVRVLTSAPRADLLGSILVAHEGINGVIAGPRQQVLAFEQALLHDDLLAVPCAGMAFKHSACTTPPFARMKVHLKDQIVAVGLPDTAAGCPGTVTVDPATLVKPDAWRALIQQDDVVVLDNRNGFEHRLGHFNGAIDPNVENFRDFPAYVQAHADEWKTAGKRVAMYCTGGIRCEKTSAWMQSLGLVVLQLEGGVLNYFQALPDADRDWVGECFVFDNRVALDTQRQETATTVTQVYQGFPDDDWRLARALRLAGSEKSD